MDKRPRGLTAPAVKFAGRVADSVPMLLAAALLVCVGTVPLLGGRLEALAALELRARWTLVAALGGDRKSVV